MAQFRTKVCRFEPYRNFKFKVKWDGEYVAGVSKVSAWSSTSRSPWSAV